MYFSRFRHGKQTADYFSRVGAGNRRESAVRPGILSSDWSRRASGRRLWCEETQSLSFVSRDRAARSPERERQRELDTLRVAPVCTERGNAADRQSLNNCPGHFRESESHSVPLRHQHQEYPETVFCDFIQSLGGDICQCRDCLCALVLVTAT